MANTNRWYPKSTLADLRYEAEVLDTIVALRGTRGEEYGRDVEERILEQNEYAVVFATVRDNREKDLEELGRVISDG